MEKRVSIHAMSTTVAASTSWESAQNLQSVTKGVRITTEDFSTSEESDASYNTEVYSRTTRSFNTSRRTTFETDATSWYTTDDDSDKQDEV